MVNPKSSVPVEVTAPTREVNIDVAIAGPAEFIIFDTELFV